jgi:hypothetical protein
VVIVRTAIGLYLNFSLYRILFYSGFSSNRFLFYSGFSLDWFHCVYVSDRFVVILLWESTNGIFTNFHPRYLYALNTSFPMSKK